MEFEYSQANQLLSYSVQTAITNTVRLGGINNQNSFSQSSRDPRSRCQRSQLVPGESTLSGLQTVVLSLVSSHGGERASSPVSFLIRVIPS